MNYIYITQQIALNALWTQVATASQEASYVPQLKKTYFGPSDIHFARNGLKEYREATQ